MVLALKHLTSPGDPCEASNTMCTETPMCRARMRSSRTAARRKLNEPISLPKNRRDVSASPRPNRRRVRRLFSRSEPGSSRSPLLDLPPEIREKIFFEVVGGNVVHLVQLPKRLGHIRCTHSSSSTETGYDFGRLCIPHLMRQRYHNGEPLIYTRDAKSSDGGLALLQTCRQIYRECVALMYTTNTFDVNHPQTLLFLGRTIIPARLAMIRSLQVSWYGLHLPHGLGSGSSSVFHLNERSMPDDVATWVKMCTIIVTQMTGLRSLKIKIEKDATYANQFWKNEISRVDAERLFRPLGTLRGLKEFQLDMSPAFWDVQALAHELRRVFVTGLKIPSAG